ncbi:MAG: transcription-repair coupling factor [Dehalococcoidia bacterium]|nr:transcription-repair coupling factor [Dehalococcoidia bacterium]
MTETLGLDALLPVLGTLDPLVEAHGALDAGHPVRLGVPDAAKTAAAALLWRRNRRPVLFIAAREADAQSYAEQMFTWLGDAAVHYPARAALAYSREGNDARVSWQRIGALARLAQAGAEHPPFVIASAAAVAEHTLRPADLGRGPGLLARGDQRGLDTLARALVDAGYEMTSLVEAPGQAARRGGLVDVYPPGAEWPVRIEFFGPEVDSIREFDPDTQRTRQQLDEVRIGPATEWFPTHLELTALADRLDDVKPANLREEVRQLRAGELPAREFYGPLAASSTILDHLKRDAIVIIDEREAIDAAFADLDDLVHERRAELAQRGELDAGAPLPHEPRDVIRVTLDGHARRAELGRWVTGNEAGAFRLPFRQADAYAGRLPEAARDMHRQQTRGDRVVIVTQQAHRYAEVLGEHDVAASVSSHVEGKLKRGDIVLLQGGLPEGWTVQTEDGIVSLQTDRELFGFVKRRRTLRQRSGSHRSRFLAEVSPGDFVVHADHGIARFGGITRREIDGEGRDYLELRYAGDDKLYVPVEQIDRVSRYNGPVGFVPRLTRLGTQEWGRARAKVREAVQIVAQDLLRLYAARQLLPGHQYGADTPWQGELENSFGYEETEDQLEAIQAVKADMESERPMDRVICGDVGFGKTEVAVRAAFKAVQEGFQVAVLVPTTVLAQQHLRTFRERLSGFPVSIDVISRFRTEQEARDIAHRARQGELDIVIGTHRLLEASVDFKNLGLVIIDEEQRFGVTHKERLKRLRLEVDVLTLSATPIPRTLHMALTGIRDMSLIETAPHGRQPVQTYVMEWDEAIVREAILHEVERGGQVFVLHNRVRSIDEFAERVRKLVPEARFVVGHGQMPEGVLRPVMEKFADGEFDVLVCTTIIESGIDIPNANTLIVDRADMLGLAQMYQLRGRVGRGVNQAYAYLFHPKNRVLTETAQARLSTIFEASELGAGFQVSLRDLEIRGAGNLLGAEQSGHIASVGFDLYTEMLSEAVEDLKSKSENRPREVLPHEERGEIRKVLIDLPVAAHVPESYVPEIESRLALYQRISGLRTLADADELVRETEDRLGELPEPLMNLVRLVRVRIASRDAGIASIRMEDGEVVITTTEQRPFIGRLMPKLPPGVRVGRTQVRLARNALGDAWLVPIEALVRLLGGAPAAEPVLA